MSWAFLLSLVSPGPIDMMLRKIPFFRCYLDFTISFLLFILYTYIFLFSNTLLYMVHSVFPGRFKILACFLILVPPVVAS